MIASRTIATVASVAVAGAIGMSADTANAQCYSGGYYPATQVYVAPAPVYYAPPPVVVYERPVVYRSYSYSSYPKCRTYTRRSYHSGYSHHGHHRGRSLSFGFSYNRH